MYTYELLLAQEYTSAEDWQRFFNVISTRVKGFSPVTLESIFSTFPNSQQYFGQVETGLQQAILSNAINYYVFKVSEEDARVLEGNLSMEIPKEIVEREMRNGLTETDIRVKIMTELHPRECIVRVAASGRLLPAMKARTMDVGIVEGTSSESGGEDLSPFARQDLPEKFAYHSAPADLPTLESEKILDSLQNVSEVTTPSSAAPSSPSDSENTSIRSGGNAPAGKTSRSARGMREPEKVDRMSVAEVFMYTVFKPRYNNRENRKRF